MSQVELCRVNSYLPIESLKLHPDNPRQISKERLQELKKSIVEKGFYQPILVWKKDNIILAGNHRYMAVKELIREGYEFNSKTDKHVLPVVIEDVDDVTAEAILFETNNHYAEWIDEKLAEALVTARDAGRDIGAFGFDPEHVDVLLKTALSDAESITGGERKIDPVDYSEISGAVIGESDEFESIVLPKPVYEQVVELLGQIAKGLNAEWKEGDSLAEASQALVQFAKTKGVDELWTSVSSKKSRTKKSKE